MQDIPNLPSFSVLNQNQQEREKGRKVLDRALNLAETALKITNFASQVKEAFNQA